MGEILGVYILGGFESKSMLFGCDQLENLDTGFADPAIIPGTIRTRNSDFQGDVEPKKWRPDGAYLAIHQFIRYF